MKFAVFSLATLLLLPTEALADQASNGSGVLRALEGKKGATKMPKEGKKDGATKAPKEGKKDPKGTKTPKEGKKDPKGTKSPKEGKKDPKGGKKGGMDKKGKKGKKGGRYFNRISSYLVCSQIDPSCNFDDETSAEIVAVSEDEYTILYTDGPQGTLGFVDITDPANPTGMGYVDVGGEPTSVGVVGGYALVAVSTGADFINPDGDLKVIDIQTQSVIHTIALGGQPDAVAISPDGNYAGVAIENERDEDLNDGVLPQLPPGAFVIVNTRSTNPTEWTTTTVNLDTGLPGVLYPSDPEPEFVSINSHNIAAITLQENNAIVLVNMETAQVMHSFSAGTVDLAQIDTIEEDALIKQDSSLVDVPREPDGVVWINEKYFATADEGDLDGGSRGFTIFDTDGNIVFTQGNDLEHLVASIGHYPDNRSENKGSEPENCFFGKFGNDHLLFVNVERSSVVAVYDVKNPRKPKLVQILPAGVEPEGGLALPNRNLVIIASEVDERDSKIRSVISIYSRDDDVPQYPTIESVYRDDGTPIPFGALSGLAPDPHNDCILYSVEDSFYLKSRIFLVDVCTSPAALFGEIRIVDTNGIFRATDTFGLINDDNTVNIDPEGIAAVYDEQGYIHFFVASEGSGAADDPGKLNQIFKIDHMGVIEQVIELPAEVNALQIRFGFEGVAEYDGRLYVAFQRAWDGEDHPRIGVYDVSTGVWDFVFYELDEPLSQNGGWVGLSDITPVGNSRFLVLERDNQGGPDAVIKKIYEIDLSSFTSGEVIGKTLFRDIVPDMLELGGLIFEKVEGLAYNNFGVWVVNDNDGVDDNSGEIQLMWVERFEW